MIKAFIFDMDGLIVETESLYTAALNHLAEEIGKKLPEKAREQIMGRDPLEGMKIFKEAVGFPASPREIFERREKIYGQILEKADLQLLPGVEKLLRLLKEKKLRIALSSSSARHWIDLILARLKIRGFFEVVVSREEVKKSKPWPEIYLLTAKKLSLTPKECLVLEDTPPGIEAAKKAGMKCLAVPNKFNQQADFSQADWVLRSLVEIDYHFLKSKLSLAN